MELTLKDAGKHSGYGIGTGSGHYEVTIGAANQIIIKTVFDNPNATQSPIVQLNAEEWDRLAAWINWQRQDIKTILYMLQITKNKEKGE
jgi:hypothetical protein